MHYLTTADIAARYGRNYRTATRWCQRGLFPHLIKGRKTASGAIYLVPETDLEGWTPPRRGRPAAPRPTRSPVRRGRPRGRRAAQVGKGER